MGSGYDQKKEKFSDSFNKDSCLLYARPYVHQHAKGLQAEGEDTVVCPTSRAHPLEVLAAWVPHRTFFQQR